MTKLNGIAPNQKTTQNINNRKNANNSKINLEQAPDTFIDSKKEDKEKIKKLAKRALLFALGTQAAIIGLVVLSMIGKDPAKAAKQLRGVATVVEPAFNKGQELLNTVMSKTGDNYATTFEGILQMAQNPKNAAPLGDSLDQLTELIQRQQTPPDKSVTEAVEGLRKNLDELTTNIQTKLQKGEEVIIYDAGEQFERENKGFLEKISDYLDDIHYNWKLPEKDKKLAGELRKDFYLGANVKCRPKTVVYDCPKEVFNTEQTLFHGTNNAQKIYENGFSPYVSKQLSSSARECGAGVYVTPDIEVASIFSSGFGNIIPVKLDKDSRVAMLDEQTFRETTNRIASYLTERIPETELDKLPRDEKNALIELLYSKTFTDMGYDAIYIPKGVSTDKSDLLGSDINDMCGRNQSQVVVLKPEKLEIQHRTLKDRIGDLGKSLKSTVQILKYAKEHPLAM